MYKSENFKPVKVQSFVKYQQAWECGNYVEEETASEVILSNTFQI